MLVVAFVACKKYSTSTSNIIARKHYFDLINPWKFTCADANIMKRSIECKDVVLIPI